MRDTPVVACGTFIVQQYTSLIKMPHADPGLGGNILNFNVGANVDLQIPRVRSAGLGTWCVPSDGQY